MKRISLNSLIVLIGFALTVVGMAPATALADVVGTYEVVQDNRAMSDRDKIEQTLEREEVQELLAEHGVDPAQAQSRVAALSDEEARELAERMDEQPIGASGVTVGLTTILLLVIIWLIVR